MINFLEKSENFSLTHYAARKLAVGNNDSMAAWTGSRIKGLGVFFSSSILDAGVHAAFGTTKVLTGLVATPYNFLASKIYFHFFQERLCFNAEEVLCRRLQEPQRERHHHLAVERCNNLQNHERPPQNGLLRGQK